MKRVFRIRGKGKVKDIGLRGLADYPTVETFDAKASALQALLPLGLTMAHDLFQDEVTQLAGPRYARTGGIPGYVRWYHQQGSIY